MADFRRCIPVLALLALILGSAVMASAQAPPAFTCNSTPAVPTNIRLEGESELVGDIVVTCTGGVSTPAGQAPNPVNIQVVLNTPVTNRTYGSALSGAVQTEALLLINEPQPGAQTLCGPGGLVAPSSDNSCAGTVIAAGNGVSYGGGASNPNIFVGYLPPPGTTNSANTLEWDGIPIDPPGTAGTLTLRFTNIRVSAINLAAGTPVFASFTATPPTSLPLPPVQNVVAIPQKGLVNVAISGTGNFLQCSTVTNGGPISVSFGEGFPSAFKIRAIENATDDGGNLPNPSGVNGLSGALGPQDLPGLFYGSESGFVSTAQGLGVGDGLPGVADFGTRIRVLFNNVGTGITLTVPQVVTSTNGNLILKQVPDESSIQGTLDASIPSPIPPVSVTGATEIVYEVVQSNVTVFESVSIPVTVSFVGNTAGNEPPLGNVTASVSFAPICTTASCTTALTGPIPRFTDTSVPTNVFSVGKCATHLLFPFVTNAAGFDTGIAIANTTVEPAAYNNSATIAQDGDCTLNFYGTPADVVVALPTNPVLHGQTHTYLLGGNTSTAGFQGYLIADCTFQYGHGFAFISDVGASRLAMGYLALIIPDPPRSPSGGASPFNCGPGSTPGSCNAGSGEQLAQ